MDSITETKWPCGVCGGIITGEVAPLYEAAGSDYDGVRICDTCNASGDAKAFLTATRNGLN